MDVRLGDILVMKKEHPCGDKRWLVLRTGMDFRLRCLGCGHEVMLPRAKAENSFSCAPLVFIVSASMRSTRASGKRSFSSCSTRCVPGVSVNSSSPPQTGQVPVILMDAPQ